MNHPHYTPVTDHGLGQISGGIKPEKPKDRIPVDDEMEEPAPIEHPDFPADGSI